MTTSAYSGGYKLGRDYQAEGWSAYINNGEYSEQQQEALVDALMAATEAEFDALLPNGAWWTPATSEITYTLGMEDQLPEDREALEDLLQSATETVIERFEQIEAEALKQLR